MFNFVEAQVQTGEMDELIETLDMCNSIVVKVQVLQRRRKSVQAFYCMY